MPWPLCWQTPGQIRLKKYPGQTERYGCSIRSAYPHPGIAGSGFCHCGWRHRKYTETVSGSLPQSFWRFSLLGAAPTMAANPGPIHPQTLHRVFSKWYHRPLPPRFTVFNVRVFLGNIEIGVTEIAQGFFDFIGDNPGHTRVQKGPQVREPVPQLDMGGRRPLANSMGFSDLPGFTFQPGQE